MNTPKRAVHTSRGRTYKSYEVFVRVKVGRKIDHAHRAFDTLRQAKAYVLNITSAAKVDFVEIREMAETTITCDLVEPV